MDERFWVHNFGACYNLYRQNFLVLWSHFKIALNIILLVRYAQFKIDRLPTYLNCMRVSSIRLSENDPAPPSDSSTGKAHMYSRYSGACAPLATTPHSWNVPCTPELHRHANLTEIPAVQCIVTAQTLLLWILPAMQSRGWKLWKMRINGGEDQLFRLGVNPVLHAARCANQRRNKTTLNYWRGKNNKLSFYCQCFVLSLRHSFVEDVVQKNKTRQAQMHKYRL